MDHKPCKKKLHAVFTVCYLFRPPSLFALSPGSCSLTAERLAAVQKASVPTRRKQMRAFLCMTGFYEQWIPSFLVLPVSLEWNTHSTILNLSPPPALRNPLFHELSNTGSAQGLTGYNGNFNLYYWSKWYPGAVLSLCPSLHIWFCFQCLCRNLSPFKKQCSPCSC